MTSFRNELNKTVVMLFVGLLFVKAFHWLGTLRMENFARGQQVDASGWTRVRLLLSLLFLLCIDVMVSAMLSYLLYQQKGFSVIVLFAFEFTILACSVFTQICKFIVLLIDRAYTNWSYKPTVMFVLDFLHDLTHLGLYSVFVWILTMNWGFPLHLLRELFMAFHTLQNRIIHFYNYSKIIKVLDTQFKTVTRQELIDSDRDVVCVICFSEMESGKELPCKHVFHLNCLKRWFEQKQECPMCRLKITPNNENRQNAPLNNERQQVLPQNNSDNENEEVDEKNQDEKQDGDNDYDSYERHPLIGYHPISPHSDPAGSYSYQNPYYAAPPYYQQHSYPLMSTDPRAELAELTRITQWKIEYYELLIKIEKQSLEHYIEIQSKWKNEEEAASSITTTETQNNPNEQ